MSYTTKNYSTNGGDKLVIGGEISFEGKAPVIYQGASVAATVSALKDDFNALLTKLKASGIVADTAPTISIALEPADITNTEGAITGALSVGASASDGRTVTYQWYSNSSASVEGGQAVSGATESEYEIPAATEVGTYYYYCVVSASDAVSKTSGFAKVVIENAITVTAQPEDLTVTAGAIDESILVAAALSGEGTLTYQWYSNATDSNTGGTIVEDATNAEFSIPTDLTAGTYYYYCVVGATGFTSVATGAATITVEA